MIGAQAGAKAPMVAAVSGCCSLLGMGESASSWPSASAPAARWSEPDRARYRYLATDTAVGLSPPLSDAPSCDSGRGLDAVPVREGTVFGGAEAAPAETEELAERARPGSTGEGSTGEVV